MKVMTNKLTVFIGALIISSLLYCDSMDWMYEDKADSEVKEMKIINSQCARPIKLKDINDNRDVNTYNTMVNQYARCIKKFINKQIHLHNSSSTKREQDKYAKSIKFAQEERDSYLNKDDVSQNQKHHSTLEFGGVGYDNSVEEQKK